MDNDDIPVGRVLSRREILTLFGGAGLAGAALLHGGAAADARRSGPPLDCVASPEMTEGPFFVDEKLDRSDIRTDPSTGRASAGAPLALTLYVADVRDGCRAVAGAMVDVWHCDAAGLYSDELDNGTEGRRFLRGYQKTDADGRVRFTTIYPGWYPGRAVHVHLKVRLFSPNGQQANEFTSQLFFDDALTDAVHAKAPYSSRGRRDTLNRGDGIYRRGGGSRMVLPVKPAASGDGYAAGFTVGLTL